MGIPPFFDTKTHTAAAPMSAVRCLRALPLLRRTALAPQTRFMSIKPHSREELEHMTGLQREEAELALEGQTLFDRSGLSGPFGTRENPVKVPSVFDRRTVACTGGSGSEEHEMLWFNLFAGHKAICPECGQFFELVKVPVPGH